MTPVHYLISDEIILIVCIGFLAFSFVSDSVSRAVQGVTLLATIAWILEVCSWGLHIGYVLWNIVLLGVSFYCVFLWVLAYIERRML